MFGALGNGGAGDRSVGRAGTQFDTEAHSIGSAGAKFDTMGYPVGCGGVNFDTKGHSIGCGGAKFDPTGHFIVCGGAKFGSEGSSTGSTGSKFGTRERRADFLRTDLAVAKLPTLFDGKHNITFHATRRTFMTLLEGEGVSRDLISALAGHSGRTVADRHYIAKNIDRFYDVVRKLPIPENLPWVQGSGPRPTV